MERNSILWLGAFLLLSVLMLAGEALGYRPLVWYTKPFLMPALALWLLSRTPGIRRFFRHTFLIGLLFATLGDIFMMFLGGAYDSLFFLLGLSAFLGTHVCYLGGFLSEINLRNGRLRQQPWLAAPFLAFLTVFLYGLWPGIPAGLRLPVLLYAVVISAMALSVVNTQGKIAREIFRSLLAGALLFMLSDCLIAVSRFGHPFSGARTLIMATYLLGQWLIVQGVAERLRQVPEK